MSTERDETTPIPAQPGGTPDSRPGGDPGGPVDHPTTPIPRPGPGRTEEPTLVLDTFAPEPDRRAAHPAAATPGPAAAPGTPATPATPAAPGTPDAAGRPPVGAAATTRTSAFAAAGPGAGAAAGAGAGAGSPVPTGGTTGPGTVPAGPGTAGSGAAGSGTTSDPTPKNSAGDKPRGRSQVRVGTVVWGLVLAIIGAGLIAIAAGATVDLELALIGLLALAGVALVVGSVVTASRRRR